MCGKCMRGKCMCGKCMRGKCIRGECMRGKCIRGECMRGKCMRGKCIRDECKTLLSWRRLSLAIVYAPSVNDNEFEIKYNIRCQK